MQHPDRRQGAVAWVRQQCRRTGPRALMPSIRLKAWLWSAAALLLLAAAGAGCSAAAPQPPAVPTVAVALLASPGWQPIPLPVSETQPDAQAVDATSTAAGALPQATRVYTDGMTGIFIPAGEFTMGLADNIPVSWPDERPQHKVYLDAYWIDRTEVTNAMYARCVQARNCRPPDSTRSFTRAGYFDDPAYADYPVIFVSWQAARQYCQWAGRRLPSEAQWEKAARGVDARLHPWGNEPPDASRGSAGNELGDTAAVGSYPAGASAYGVLDTAGNVWEWVADLYGSDYYKNSPRRNPQGPDWGNSRLVRGGSWSVTQRTTTTAERAGYGYRATEDRIGIRCALP